MIVRHGQHTFKARLFNTHAHALHFVVAACALLSLTQCEPYDPDEGGSGLFEPCCSGAGTCIPQGSVAASDAMRLGKDICGSALLCAPAELAEDATLYVAPSCKSFGRIEGRCLLSCLPDVMKDGQRLQRDGCAENALCVPCYDPLTSKDTGACKVGGDPGPKAPPAPFATCCDGNARCIPETIVPADRRASFAANSCDPGTHSLCVPRVWVNDANAKPATCTAHGGAEGRCMSECLPEVARRGSQLRVDACEQGEKCVPCYDPISGESTGSCDIGDDAPKSPKQLFGACCGSIGACVPTEAVELEDRARLSADTCEQADTMCVPRDWIALDRKAVPLCHGYGGAEGRCLPSCLPDVGRQAGRLSRDVCAPANLCVPCYDPITGEDTGACTIGGGVAPIVRYTFGGCCGDLGRCVPVETVAAADRSRLDSNNCAGGPDELCAPSKWISDPPTKPASCRPYGDFEGRCLPECLPGVANRLDSLRRDSCEAGERCAPCYDPLTGGDTGACSINGDKPAQAPRIFADCCGDVGACVPQDGVGEYDRVRLNNIGCIAGAELCAPKLWVQNQRAKPTACRALGINEGRCLPSCLPDVAKRAGELTRETCADTYLCVPCFDPRTLDNTHACDVGDDAAQERPGGFSECCGGIGWCVPDKLVKSEDRSRLDTCAGSPGQVCAPEAWVTSQAFIPASCTAPGEIAARCLPECLPDVAKRRDKLTEADCPDQHLCVPCFDPVTGDDTGACSVGDDKPDASQGYAGCCGEAGLCVPSELIPTADRKGLGLDSCNPNTQTMCVPRVWASGPRTVPPACRAVDNAEGRCLSSCLPEIGAQRDQLRQGSCGASDLCVPCYDPLDGHDTGACTTTGDRPAERPYTFPQCCSSQGRCVPSDLVSSEDRGSLDANSCSGQHLCAPNDWLGDKPKAAPTCHGLLGAEGRCLPNCLPAVAKQGDNLVKDVCSANNSCVPCFDPITGASTAACTQGNDSPKEPARTFGGCCHDAGRCVPSSSVDPADRNQLNHESCGDPADALCVPSSWLTQDPHIPNTCRAPGNVEGRCLMSCLPNVAGRAASLRQTSCAAQELCVPCFDPLTGENTGACAVDGDAPHEPAARYPECCGTEGTCVPTELLNDDQKSSLAVDSCGGGAYCVPDAAARGGDPGFPACRVSVTINMLTVDLGTGACINGCFIAPTQRTILQPNGCGASLCAPCAGLGITTNSCTNPPPAPAPAPAPTTPTPVPTPVPAP